MSDNIVEKASRTFPVTEYVPKALQELAPGSVWKVTGDFNYEDIEWLSEDIPLPSKELVMTKAQELKDAYDTLEYSRMRAVSYPSIEQQLDVLYHEGYDGWKEVIDSIKAQYPKTV
jgi:hypothetical protein